MAQRERGGAPAGVRGLGQSRRPTLADIIGARRVWTVAMISLGIDALEVDRGGAQVGVTQLTLDDVQRHALAGELDRMRVTQLMRREAAPDPRRERRAGGTRCARPAGA